MRARTSGAVLAVVVTFALLGSLFGCANATDTRAALVGERGESTSTPKPRPTGKSVLEPSNPGFELASDGKRCPLFWTCGGKGRAVTAVDGEQHRDGSQSLRISVPNEADQFTLASRPLPAQPNRQYVGIVWRRSASSTPTGGESIRLRFLDEKRQLVGVESVRRDRPGNPEWSALTAKADAPAKAAFVQVEVSVQGPSPAVWLDDIMVRHTPILDVWGGTGLHRGKGSDTLTLQFTTPTPGGVHIGSIDALGARLTVADGRTLTSDQGGRLSYQASGTARYDPQTRTIRVAPGGAAKIVVTGGRFTPTPGTGFPKAIVYDPVGESEFAIFVAARNFPDSENPQTLGLANTFQVRRTVDRLSDYLDSRMTAAGGWSVTHIEWPTKPAEDPLAISALTEGYLARLQSASSASAQQLAESRARRGLDWMVAHQRPDGGFGLPWAYGAAEGHYPAAEHYHSSLRKHPAGEAYAVLTAKAGTALLSGYKVLGDARYLTAARRAMNKLLRGPDGFQFLDAAKTRGSVPYCTLEPARRAGDPLIAAHSDVLPALRNTSVEVYNIDGATLSFIAALYLETGDRSLLGYGDPLATNLAHRMNPNGSIPYAWHQPSYKSGPYAAIVFSGLLSYGELRQRQDWIDKARRGYSWMANEAATGYLPTENYATVFGLDLSLDVSRFLNNAVGTQHANGSFSGGANTRQDAVMFSILSGMLLDVGG